MGERILICPYIAIVADFILFHPFLQTVPTLTASVGTFPLKTFLEVTGMYVKPILNCLNGIGFMFLSHEAQEKKKGHR